jgi:uncharacterized membrane protein
MSDVADARINNFASQSTQSDFVSQADEPTFILTTSQLRGIITEAVEEATKLLSDRLSALDDRVTAQSEEITRLAALQETEISRVCVDIAYDRQRLAKLERVEPQPLQKDRGEILRALLAANGGKMLRSQARKKMHLSESRFSELLATMVDYIETRPYHLNESWKVLILK